MICHHSPPKIMEIKQKINKWDLIKLIRFFTAKESINKVKRQPSGWNKIITKGKIGELLISKICKQLTQLNTRKTNKPVRKWAKDLNKHFSKDLSLVQFSSVSQSCLTLCDPMHCSTPGLPIHHQLPEFTQTHVHRVGDAIQPSHPLSSPFPPAPNSSQHQSLFQ